MNSDQQQRYICAPDITTAWIKALESLQRKPNREAFNLAVRIENPTIELPGYREIIEDYFGKCSRKWKKDQIQMVAQTIFPYGYLHHKCPDPTDPEQREAFYKAYLRNSPIVRSLNPKGTYFQRLICWPSWSTLDEERINQLEIVIEKINKAKVRVVFEMALGIPSVDEIYDMKLYNPVKDKKYSSIMAFPCLSHISIKPELVGQPGGKIHMTALYRNHYFVERAYGNYLGLGLLLKFIADASEKEVGELFCISSLAKIDDSYSNKKISGFLNIIKKCGVA